MRRHLGEGRDHYGRGAEGRVQAPGAVQDIREDLPVRHEIDRDDFVVFSEQDFVCGFYAGYRCRGYERGRRNT